MQSEHDKLMELLEQLSLQYATDEEGVFSLPDYIAFKAGVLAGMAAQQQLDFNSKLPQD